jgi:hypothetical protein
MEHSVIGAFFRLRRQDPVQQGQRVHTLTFCVHNAGEDDSILPIHLFAHVGIGASLAHKVLRVGIAHSLEFFNRIFPKAAQALKYMSIVVVAGFLRIRIRIAVLLHLHLALDRSFVGILLDLEVFHLRDFLEKSLITDAEAFLGPSVFEKDLDLGLQIREQRLDGGFVLFDCHEFGKDRVRIGKAELDVMEDVGDRRARDQVECIFQERLGLAFVRFDRHCFCLPTTLLWSEFVIFWVPFSPNS